MLRIISAGAAATLAFGIAAAASAQPQPAQSFPFRSGPVTITSCSLGQSGNVVSDNSLLIKYFQNVPRRHLVSVTFLVRYAGQTVTVTDTGRFTFDAPIDHKFNSLGGRPWAGPDPEICRVLNATFGDGQTVQPSYIGPSAQEPGRVADPTGTPPPYAVPAGPASAPPPPAPTATS